MVGALRDEHLRQQPEVEIPLSMISAGTGVWIRRLALRAGPLAANVALDGEHARDVVQLLADIVCRTERDWIGSPL